MGYRKNPVTLYRGISPIARAIGLFIYIPPEGGIIYVTRHDAIRPGGLCHLYLESFMRILVLTLLFTALCFWILASVGEPTSAWLVCEVMRLCES